jgi:predicted dehydrogenase
MVNLVRQAGVMHGYAETEVFSPDVMRAQAMIASGAIGDVLTVRAREAHSGPHAPHFWDVETAGGGALLDMGCHTIEAARYFFGKENQIKDVFAWGATLVHKEKTKGEDNAVLLLRLEDGRTSLTEASWTAKGGMELRNEVYGTMGRIVTDTSSTRIRAFIQEPAGYLMEKADADVGWVFPIPDEARVYGYQEEMRHFVQCFVEGKQPREDFVDGYIVNCVLDAAYKSMQSGHWEPVQVDSRVTG